MAKIIDGKKLSKTLLNKISLYVKKNNLKLKLVVFLIGDDFASFSFVKEKEKACQSAGIDFQLFRLPKTISQKKIEEIVKKISLERENSGIIVQLPLPKKLKEKEILNLIPCEKDIDVLSDFSLGKFYNDNSLIYPPTVSAVKKILEKEKIKLKGANVLVVGSGKLVGRPLSLWLLNQKATVSVVNKFSKDFSYFSKKADLIFSAAGSPKIINSRLIKKGSILIDLGYCFQNGKIVGDIDTRSVLKKAKIIAPVPGGVGPLTVACLLENLFVLNSFIKKRHRILS